METFEKDDPVKHLAAGWTTTVAVTEKGSLYEWGWSKNVVSLLRTARRYGKKREWLSRLQKLTWLGWFSYNRGSNSPEHLLTLRPPFDDELAKRELEQAEREGAAGFSMCDAGGEFAAAVSKSGFVFTWGAGVWGQLGTGQGFTRSNTQTPTAVVLRVKGEPEVRKAVSVACGFQHVLALDSKGDVWSWGKGESGALGLLRVWGESKTPMRDLPVNIRQSNTDYVVESATYTMSSGAASRSRRRNDERPDHIPIGRIFKTPESYSPLPAVKQISAGMNFSLFLTEKGDVYSCGKNVNYELGIPGFVDEFYPVRVDIASILRDTQGGSLAKGESIVQVSAGSHHSAVLTSRGRVITWGMNRHGQCGVAASRAVLNMKVKQSNVITESARATPPTVVQVQGMVRKVVAGFHDTAMIMRDGRVLRVGSGFEASVSVNDNPERMFDMGVASVAAVSDVVFGWKHALAIGSEKKPTSG